MDAMFHLFLNTANFGAPDEFFRRADSISIVIPKPARYQPVQARQALKLEWEYVIPSSFNHVLYFHFWSWSANQRCTSVKLAKTSHSRVLGPNGLIPGRVIPAVPPPAPLQSVLQAFVAAPAPAILSPLLAEDVEVRTQKTFSLRYLHASTNSRNFMKG